MQEFSVDNATMPDLLAVLAKGEPLRLLENGQEVGTASPPTPKPNEDDGRKPFAVWVQEWREKYEIDKYGLTDEEVEAMRDRSPGPKPINFDE